MDSQTVSLLATSSGPQMAEQSSLVHWTEQLNPLSVVHLLTALEMVSRTVSLLEFHSESCLVLLTVLASKMALLTAMLLAPQKAEQSSLVHRTEQPNPPSVVRLLTAFLLASYLATSLGPQKAE